MNVRKWMPFLLILAISVASVIGLGMKLLMSERRMFVAEYRYLFAEHLKQAAQLLHAVSTEVATEIRDELLTHGSSTHPLVRGVVTERVSEADESYRWSTTEPDPVLHLRAGGMGYRVTVNYAALIARLLSTQISSAASINPSRGYMRLVTREGKLLQQWGRRPDTPEVEMIASLGLAAPLERLEVRAYLTRDPMNSPFLGSAFITFGSGLLLLVEILTLLGIYFYRAHTAELERAGYRMELANKVSHELRTPLTNVRMYAELLAYQLDDDDSPAQAHLRVIVSETQRLNRLIETFLTFGAEQRAPLTTHCAPACVATLVEEVLAHFRLLLAEKQITVSTDISDRSLVEVDADFIRQIVGNLIANVERHAADGRALTIAVWRESTYTAIAVSDRGKGIPIEIRQKLFSQYGRLSTSSHGAGLGLYISRELARAHGGDISLNTGINGSTFTVRINTPPVAYSPERSDESLGV